MKAKYLAWKDTNLRKTEVWSEVFSLPASIYGSHFLPGMKPAMELSAKKKLN
jgi:hypothetical protein